MQAVAGICLLLFGVVSTLVGLRVLIVARRTTGRPELLMGTGMVLIGVDTASQDIVVGLVLVGAVGIDQLLRRRAT